MTKSFYDNEPRDNIAELAQLSDSNPGSRSPVCVTMGYTQGKFQLSWESIAPQKYDWIGLYANEREDDANYIGGDNWQWVLNGQSYITNTPVLAGYQARYLIWDYTGKKYISVAKTKPFPATKVSSND